MARYRAGPFLRTGGSQMRTGRTRGVHHIPPSLFPKSRWARLRFPGSPLHKKSIAIPWAPITIIVIGVHLPFPLARFFIGPSCLSVFFFCSFENFFFFKTELKKKDPHRDFETGAYMDPHNRPRAGPQTIATETVCRGGPGERTNSRPVFGHNEVGMYPTPAPRPLGFFALRLHRGFAGKEHGKT